MLESQRLENYVVFQVGVKIQAVFADIRALVADMGMVDWKNWKDMVYIRVDCSGIQVAVVGTIVLVPLMVHLLVGLIRYFLQD